VENEENLVQPPFDVSLLDIACEMHEIMEKMIKEEKNELFFEDMEECLENLIFLQFQLLHEQNSSIDSLAERLQKLINSEYYRKGRVDMSKETKNERNRLLQKLAAIL
jgi:hypothetical protein